MRERGHEKPKRRHEVDVGWERNVAQWYPPAIMKDSGHVANMVEGRVCHAV